MQLIATMTLAQIGDLAEVILMVAAGLGFVIFVHELGHFLVAKLCGVKCEKFYLGFDVGGLKLLKFRWGETEYGIGILPFGGYVKMLGQDDNPSGEAADLERAKNEPLDPRSYKAQSVPERMAIISAGVIMNLIFACVMGAIAYGIGVTDDRCMISGTFPGETAWQADMQPGDEIIQIDDRPADEQLRFRDLQKAVMFSNPGTGVRFKIKRDGVAEPFWIALRPERAEDRLAPTIGAIGPSTTTLHAPEPAAKRSPAAEAGFEAGDKIVAVDGEPTPDFAQLTRQLAHHPDDKLIVTVERPAKKPAGAAGKAADGAEPAPPARVEVPVRANPMRSLGLEMKLGPISAVQEHSVAAEAGIKPGDTITSIDDEPVGDPLTLPDRMRRKAGTPVKLSLERKSAGGEPEHISKTVTPRRPDWWEEAPLLTSPQAVTALGIAYSVLSQVAAVVPDSPAAGAEISGSGEGPKHLEAGMEFTHFELIAPKTDKQGDAEDSTVDSKPVKLGADYGWACLHQLLQDIKPGTKVKLTLADKRSVELVATPAADWFNPDRGFLFEPDRFLVQAHSVGEAARMGIRETGDGVGQVYGFLRRLGNRRISPLGFGGPITIAREAGHQASRGISQLLIFLTMLSANLAVINFLPIPILDGGHMVFLALEAVFRRPVNERVQLAFTYAGLVFILGLMVFVVGLDVGRLFSWI